MGLSFQLRVHKPWTFSRRCPCRELSAVSIGRPPWNGSQATIYSIGSLQTKHFSVLRSLQWPICLKAGSYVDTVGRSSMVQASAPVGDVKKRTVSILCDCKSRLKFVHFCRVKKTLPLNLSAKIGSHHPCSRPVPMGCVNRAQAASFTSLCFWPFP